MVEARHSGKRGDAEAAENAEGRSWSAAACRGDPDSMGAGLKRFETRPYTFSEFIENTSSPEERVLSPRS